VRTSWDGEGGGDEVEDMPASIEAAIAEKEMQRTNVTHTVINVSQAFSLPPLAISVCYLQTDSSSDF
jgi:hypothetical protein